MWPRQAQGCLCISQHVGPLSLACGTQSSRITRPSTGRPASPRARCAWMGGAPRRCSPAPPGVTAATMLAATGSPVRLRSPSCHDDDGNPRCDCALRNSRPLHRNRWHGRDKHGAGLPCVPRPGNRACCGSAPGEPCPPRLACRNSRLRCQRNPLVPTITVGPLAPAGVALAAAHN